MQKRAFKIAKANRQVYVLSFTMIAKNTGSTWNCEQDVAVMLIIYSTYEIGWQIGNLGNNWTYQQEDPLERRTSCPPGWQGGHPDSSRGLPGGAPAPGTHWSGGKGGCEPASGSPPWAVALSGMLCGDWDSPAGQKQKVKHKCVT